MARESLISVSGQQHSQLPCDTSWGLIAVGYEHMDKSLQGELGCEFTEPAPVVEMPVCMHKVKVRLPWITSLLSSSRSAHTSCYHGVGSVF